MRTSEIWLLLRGLGREQRHWFDFPRQLESELGARTVLLDLPGTGSNARLRAPRRIEDTADFVASQLNRLLGPTRPAMGVLALSLGGMVGLALAQRHPHFVRCLVLVNSSSALSPPWQRMKPRGLMAILQAVAEPDAWERERIIYRLTTQLDSSARHELADQAAEWARSTTLSKRTVLRQLVAASRFHPPSPNVSTLILSGACDRLVDPRCSARLAQHLGAAAAIHPTGGHELTLDDPRWVLKRIGAWLPQER